jgi:SAM-dependent methyltransferase
MKDAGVGMAGALEHENERARRAWNTNAVFWDERMGEGNDFFNVLVWPAVEHLLQPATGERLLDVACGNGLTSRWLAQARKRDNQKRIDYRTVDATNCDELLALGVAASFDGGLCNMALMDMAEIAPLMESLVVLLRPGGRFVLTIMHPCFNNPAIVHVGELEDREGSLVSTYSIKVSRYMTPYSQVGLAMKDQPEPHPYFHRPLQELLRPAFEVGLVLDGLQEMAFPKGHPDGSTPMSWGGRFSELPAVLAVRLLRGV